MAINKVVFLFDVDNMLLDNDRVTADLRRHADQIAGREGRQRYFKIFEEIRSELGYADYLGALQRYRIENPHDPYLLEASYFLANYPFANPFFRMRLMRSNTVSNGELIELCCFNLGIWECRKIPNYKFQISKK